LLKTLVTHSTAPAPPRFVQRTSRQVVVRLATTPTPRAVRLAVSTDGGYTFEQHSLSIDPADGAYHLKVALPASAVLIAEVERSDGVVVTSPPVLPPGFSPHVRPFGPPTAPTANANANERR
jgi:hypothetical protein